MKLSQLESWMLVVVQHLLEILLEKQEQNHLQSRGKEGPSIHTWCSVDFANNPTGMGSFLWPLLPQLTPVRLGWVVPEVTVDSLGKRNFSHLLYFKAEPVECRSSWWQRSEEFKKQRQRVSMTWTFEVSLQFHLVMGYLQHCGKGTWVFAGN